MVPVHPQDHSLLGVQWEGQVFVDAALPPRPSIHTKNFQCIADGLEWIAKEHGVERFITHGAANSDECKLNLQMLLDVCNHPEVPTPQEKVEGPSTRTVFWAY